MGVVVLVADAATKTGVVVAIVVAAIGAAATFTVGFRISVFNDEILSYRR